MKIRKETYGLVLISDNCYKILEDDIPRGLKNRLGKSSFINFWTLFGVHDTAILVRSPDRLDEAVNAIGGWIAELNGKQIPVNEHVHSIMQNDLDSSIKDKCKTIVNIYKNNKIEKRFKIFEYRVDPLIPIYINNEKIESNDGVFLIMYIKFALSSVNKMLNEENRNIQDFYTPFMNEDIAAIFQGFGLFDVIIIAKKRDYNEIREEIIKIRNTSVFPISETYSLFSENISLEDLGYESLNCSMLVKVRAGAESHEIWKGIKEIALAVGLDGLCIRKAAHVKPELISCPPYTSFRAGCFDLAIDLRFEKIADLQNFINILDCMPFIEDTSTSISYDTDLPIGCDDSYVPPTI